MRQVMGMLCALLLAGSANAQERSGWPEIRATSIYRGIEEPGKFGPANLFDGKAETSFCAAGGEPLHLSFTFSDEGAATLEKLTAIRLSTNDSESRKVTIRIYYPYAPYAEQTQSIEARIENGALQVDYARGDKRRAHELDVKVSWTDKQSQHRPVCLSELALLGQEGLLHVPELSSAVERSVARDRRLGGLAGDKSGTLKLYLVSFQWIRLNPHKKSSTWESASYDFHDDGSFARTTHDLSGPCHSTGTWSLGAGADSLMLQNDDLHRLDVRPCAGRSGYVCLIRDAERLFPSPAW